MRPLKKLSSMNFQNRQDSLKNQRKGNQRFLSSFTIFDSNSLWKKEEELLLKTEKEQNVDSEHSILTKREVLVPKPIQPSITNIDSILADLGLINKTAVLNNIFIKTVKPENKKDKVALKTSCGSFRKLITSKEEIKKEGKKELTCFGDRRNKQYHLFLPYNFNYTRNNKTRILLKRKQKHQNKDLTVRYQKIKKMNPLKKEIRKLKDFWSKKTKKIPFTFKIFDNKFKSLNYKEEVIELSGKLVRPKNFGN